MRTAIFTIVSNNYLHFARTLLQSVAQHHPQAARYCVIVDRDMAPAQALADEFTAVPVQALSLPDGDDFLFQYTVLELNTAVKPWALEHLMNQGFDQVLYIDPDIRLYRPLEHVTALLESQADIVLTPHLTSPMTDDKRPTELDIRVAGTYNLGFCAMRRSDSALRCLRWWQGKLRQECVVAIERGIFVDQSWMDLVPGLFDRVAILRHPGYNAAYWNVAQRPVSRDGGGGWMVSGQPLHFYHYSGLNPRDPAPVSKHQNRLSFDNIGTDAKALHEEYAAMVMANGMAQYSALRYAFDRYDDGAPILPSDRTRFRLSEEVRRACAGRPFAQGRGVSLHHDETTADLSLDPVHVKQVQSAFVRLLGRMPERAAVLHFAQMMGSPRGVVRAVWAIGTSPEARSRPGWLRRLLQFGHDVRQTPRAAKVLLRLCLGVLRRVGSALRAVAPDPGMAVHHTPVPPREKHLLIRQQRHGEAPQRAMKDLRAPAGINLVGYLKAELGVGEAARSMARACAAAGVPFSVFDVGYQSPNRQSDDTVLHLAEAGTFPVDLLYVNADQAALTAQHLQQERGHAPHHTIGFWHWEQPELPHRLHAAFAHVDEVWVPSTFVHDAVAAVSPVPVFKVPHALSVTASEGARRERFGLPADRLLVLMMYDFHSYQYRKNPQAAIGAFRQAHKRCAGMTLVVKTINGAAHPQALAELREQLRDLPDVVFIDQFLTRQETWDLQACCDVLLSLHRAEGFGLAPAEMMHLGKAVVATGWSANMDFMTAENSMPVRFELKPLEQDLGAYGPGPLWAEADVEHAAWCLEQLMRDAPLRARLGARAAADVKRQLNPETVGQLVRQRLQALGHWYPHLNH